MLIRINCPNPKCKKQLRIDAKHAGKKISCTGCKQHIRLPTAEELKITVAASPSKGVPGEEQIVDFDAMAAEAVTFDKAAVEEANKTEMVEFTCPQCDEPVKLPIENAGKRAPCPACRRIIAVPKVDTGKPKDWREKQAQGPALAKKEEVKLEGAWGNEAVARVSLEALEEAKALPKVKRKITAAEYVRYGVYAVLLLTVLGIGWWGWSRYRASSLESNTLASIGQALQDSKLTPEMHAVLHLGLGEWMLRNGTSENVKKEGGNELKKAVPSNGDPLWNWALAKDVADMAGSVVSLDASQTASIIDLQYLVQLLASVRAGEPRDDVLRTLCRSVLKHAQRPEKLEAARNLLTAVIKQAMPPTSMKPSKDAAAGISQDYSEQLNGLGILAQELIRIQAKEVALQVVGKTADRGERTLFKKGMPVPKAFVAAMAALGQQDWEVNKDQETEFELGKMTGLFLAGQDVSGEELFRKRRDSGFAEVNLLPFLDIAEQSIDANRLPEALSRLTQAMSVAQIYTERRTEAWKTRIYAHVRLCELTARAGEMALAAERIAKLKLDEIPSAAQLARALVARHRSVQTSDADTLLAGLTAGSAGQALAAYSLSRQMAEQTRSVQTKLDGKLTDGPVQIVATLGALVGYKRVQPLNEAK